MYSRGIRVCLPNMHLPIFLDNDDKKKESEKEIDFMHFWRIAAQKAAKSIFGPENSSKNRILKIRDNFFVPGNPQLL